MKASTKAYDPGQSLREARDVYFSENDFGESGGYDDPWVHVKLGPLEVQFPNTPRRKIAVRFHDLHHIVTGYDTTMTGESEISAWELGSGCFHMGPMVIQLNLAGLFAGLLTSPRRVLRAYIRGRRSKNFYGRTYDDALLDTALGHAKNELGLDPPPPAKATARDTALLLAYAAGGAVALVTFSVMVVPATAVAIPLSWLRGRNRTPAM